MPSPVIFSGYFLRFILLIISLSISSLTLGNEDPRSVVEKAAQKMTERLITDKDKISSQSYYLEHLVDELLLPYVDHVYMAKRVLAKNWKKTSKEQKKQFVGAFKHKVIRTYAGAFKAFNGEEIQFQKAKFNKQGKKSIGQKRHSTSGRPCH
jgi:ABC-type transporter MlaC component